MRTYGNGLRRTAFVPSVDQYTSQPVVAHLARLRCGGAWTLHTIVGANAIGIAGDVIRRCRFFELELRLAIGNYVVQCIQVLAVLGKIHIAPARVGRKLLSAHMRHGGRQHEQRCDKRKQDIGGQPRRHSTAPFTRPRPHRIHRSSTLSGGVTGPKPPALSPGDAADGVCASPRIPAGTLCGCGGVRPARCIIHSMSKPSLRMRWS